MNSRQNFAEHSLDIYAQVDFAPTHGIGSRLYAENGSELIDLAGGIAVNALGHAHPKMIEAITQQANKLWHTSNIMINQPALQLANTLVNNSCFDKVFLCNSGTEAVEAGLKLARRFARQNYSANKHKIVSFKKCQSYFDTFFCLKYTEL